MLRKNPFALGEYYHLYNRGIDKRIIFKSIYDYQRFVMLLYITNSQEPIRLDNLINILHKNYYEILSCDRGKQLVSIGAWCLMPNHFHILIKEEVDGGISKFMKKVGTGYSMYFNKKYKRAGGLFGGPFKSKYIADDRYLKHLFGYIHLNPLEIKFSDWEEIIEKQNSKKDWDEFLKKYQYSSFQDYLSNNRSEKNILNKEAFPKYFLSDNDFDNFIKSYVSFTPD